MTGSGAPPDGGDLPPEEFRRLGHEVVDWIADYLEGVERLPVLSRVAPGEVRAGLAAEPPEEGEPLDAALADFRRVVVPGITHWNHPGFMGYFAITGSVPGILGEMLAAALNVNGMVWRSSPAVTELEELAADWLRQLLGLPAGFDGVINDTASSSSLYAFAAAREVAYRDAHRTGLFGQAPGRVYASDQAHSSIEKAVLTLGFGQDGYRRVPSDSEFRMRPEALGRAMAEDAGRGIQPVAVVATLGTTSSASLDPVREIAEVAREHGAWLHVDAAYGGPAAIVPELRPLLDGWEEADSIVVNPHKWLFTPVDCSLLYCRRPEELVRAFSIVPDYLSTPGAADGARNMMDYGVALGRRFRALKLWFVLRSFGRAGIVARLRAHVALARELADRIEAEDGWEVVAPTHLSTVACRWTAGGDDARADRANLRILERVNSTGEVFLTHTVLGGRTTIRVAIGNLRTTEVHVARAWALLREAAQELEAEG